MQLTGKALTTFQTLKRLLDNVASGQVYANGDAFDGDQFLADWDAAQNELEDTLCR